MPWVVDRGNEGRRREAIEWLSFAANDLRTLVQTAGDLEARVEHEVSAAQQADALVTPARFSTMTIGRSLRGCEDALAAAHGIDIMLWQEETDDVH